MRRLRLFLLFCFCGLVAAATPAAGPRPEEDTILLLPVQIHGDYKPVTAAEYKNVMLAEVTRRAPGLHLALAPESDLAEVGYRDFSQPPSADQVKKLCSRFHCGRAAWMAVRFRAGLEPGEETDPATVVSVTGAARLVFCRSTGEVILDEPGSATHSTKVASDQTSVTDKAESALAMRCVSDLAESLVALGAQPAAQKRVQDWAKAQSGTHRRAAPPTALYRRLETALQAYQKAVERGDVVSAAERQRESVTLYPALRPEEREQLEDEFPGTEQWMLLSGVK